MSQAGGGAGPEIKRSLGAFALAIAGDGLSRAFRTLCMFVAHASPDPGGFAGLVDCLRFP
ncbi:hypothetical protein GQ53DRAFT_756312 [Thozetella sp. PMI_491]|nr:hypothetical protein GQ53DRAFT_756312 [Thozetella sp. PMI_491]